MSGKQPIDGDVKHLRGIYFICMPVVWTSGFVEYVTLRTYGFDDTNPTTNADRFAAMISLRTSGIVDAYEARELKYLYNSIKQFCKHVFYATNVNPNGKKAY